MTLSAGSIRRTVRLSLALAVVIGILIPTVARAGDIEEGAVEEETSVIVESDFDAALVNVEITSCAVSDPSKGDHHEKKSWAEKAEEWEDGATKHEKAGNHKAAGDAYDQAGCNWERAGELENAAEAYEKAAEQYKKAGEDDLAAAARKRARELRESLR